MLRPLFLESLGFGISNASAPEANAERRSAFYASRWKDQKLFNIQFWQAVDSSFTSPFFVLDSVVLRRQTRYPTVPKLLYYTRTSLVCKTHQCDQDRNAASGTSVATSGLPQDAPQTGW